MASGRWTGEPPPKRTFLMNGVVVAGAPSEPPPGSKAEFTNGSCRRSKSSWPPGTGRPQPLFFTPGRQETECVYDSCDAPGATPAEATKRSRERARSTRPCSRAATTDPAGDLFRSIGPTVTLRGRPRRPRPYAFPPDRGGCRARAPLYVRRRRAFRRVAGSSRASPSAATPVAPARVRPSLRRAAARSAGPAHRAVAAPLPCTHRTRKVPPHLSQTEPDRCRVEGRSPCAAGDRVEPGAGRFAPPLSGRRRSRGATRRTGRPADRAGRTCPGGPGRPCAGERRSGRTGPPGTCRWPRRG